MQIVTFFLLFDGLVALGGLEDILAGLTIIISDTGLFMFK